MNNSFDAYMDCVKAAIKAVIEPFQRFLDVFSSPLISFMCLCCFCGNACVLYLQIQKQFQSRDKKAENTYCLCLNDGYKHNSELL